MRTIGMRLCASIAACSCSGVVTWSLSSTSPGRCLALASRASASAAVICCGDAVVWNTSGSIIGSDGASSGSCERLTSSASRNSSREMTPWLTSSSPSGRLRLRIWLRSAWARSSGDRMRSEISASPRRSIGVRDCSSSACASCGCVIRFDLDEHLAELEVAQALLFVECVLQLLRRQRVLADEHVAQARSEVDAAIGAARIEGALHEAAVADRREQEQALFGLDMADRAAGVRLAVVELNLEFGVARNAVGPAGAPR